MVVWFLFIWSFSFYLSGRLVLILCPCLYNLLLICGQASKPVQILEFNNDGETEFHWGSAGRQPFGNAGERQTFGNPGPGLMTTAAVDVDQAIAGTAWQTLQSETVLHTALVITKSFFQSFWGI